MKQSISLPSMLSSLVAIALTILAGQALALTDTTNSHAVPGIEDVQGDWWILGNVTRGTLKIVIEPNKQVSGLIYNQPIRGTWDEKLGELNFDRFSDQQAKTPFQSWKGKLVKVECNGRDVYVWAGTFQSIDEKGQVDPKVYNWTGQSVTKPAPTLDLKSLQGDWRVESVTLCNNRNVKLPDSIGLNSRGTHIEVVGNQLKINGQTTASLVNDLQSATLASQVGFDGSRVLLLTTSSGQGLICSYYIENDVVEIAYPHTTSCHRGSGHIVKLHRQAREQTPEK